MMGKEVIEAFADELEKIALDHDLKKKRDHELIAKYMAIGAAAGPALGIIRGAIAGGKTSFKENIFGTARPARWVLAGMASGAAASGAVPFLRGMIDKKVRKKYQLKQERRDVRRHHG